MISEMLEEFSGQNVLVVGSNFSAEDVALQTYKYGAKLVTISYRTRKFGFKWPATIKEVPLWTGFQWKTVEFQDGTREDYDSIIICTGNRNHIPFLPENLRLVATNRPYPANLYQKKSSRINRIFCICPCRMLYLHLSFPVLKRRERLWCYSRSNQAVGFGRTRKNDMKNWLSNEPHNHDYLGCTQFQVDFINNLLFKINFLPIDMEDGLADIMMNM